MSVTLLFVPGQVMQQVEGNLDPPKYELSILATQRLQRYNVISDGPSWTNLAFCYLEKFPKLREQIAESQPLRSIRTAPGLLDNVIDLLREPSAREQDMRNLSSRGYEISNLVAQLPSKNDWERDPCHQRTRDGRYPPGEYEDWFDKNLIDMTDGKQCPDYDPDQEGSVYEDSEDAESWAEVGSNPDNKPLLPRFYEKLDIEKPRDHGHVWSQYYDDSEITCE